MDNDSNWEDVFTTNPNTNLTSNRPISSTHLQLKLYQSSNTNEYLVDLPILLMLIRPLVLILIQGELKPVLLIPLVALSLTSSIISCFSVTSISMLIQHNLTWILQKSTLQ